MSEAPKRILPPPVKAAGVWFFRDVVCGLVTRMPRPDRVWDGPVSVHLLMSGATRKMGLMALKSFEWATGRRWETFIHDDGTMSGADVEAVKKIIPEARLVRRAEADERMDKELARYPAAAANRKKHPWFLKFLDCAVFAPHEDYIVLDTDVIFYRRPAEILEWAEARPGTCHFMRDLRETYCSPREVIKAKTGLDLWEAVNSGICLMPKRAVNFDLAEGFLRSFENEARHYIFLEQTLFAVAGSAHGKGGTLPAAYEISWKTFRRKEAIVRHYVGIIKHDLLYLEGGLGLLRQRLFGCPKTC